MLPSSMEPTNLVITDFDLGKNYFERRENPKKQRVSPMAKVNLFKGSIKTGATFTSTLRKL